MAGSQQAFISYASGDAAVAERVCARLERDGITCWYAGRDQTPGTSYAEGIIDAINRAGVLILVLSRNANTSQHVQREVERAVAKGLPVVPVRIDEFELSKPLEYLVSSQHWLVAARPPTDNQLDRLAAAVTHVLGQPPTANAATGPAKRPGRVLLLLIPVFVAALAWAGYLLFRQRPPATPTPGRADSTSTAALADSANKPLPLREQYSQTGLTLELWTPRGQNPLYYGGERVQVNVKASADCYVYVLDVATDSSVVWLVSNSGGNVIRGQRVYSIPDDIGQRVDFTVTAPFGSEVIKAFAAGCRLPAESLFALPGTVEEKVLRIRAFAAGLPGPVPYAEQFLMLRSEAKRQQ